MARVQTIIVGGGVGAVAPFTTGTVPLISSSDPPALSDSIIVQQSVTEIIIGTDPDGTATEKLRFSGGAMIAAAVAGAAVADTVAIGKGAGVTTANKTGNITIGAGAVVSHVAAASTRNVVIGDAAVFSSSNGSSVVLGATASITGAAQGICIGFGAIISAGSGICIGNGASVAQSSSVCIGDSAAVASGASNSTAVGGATSAAGNSSTALGYGCTIAAGGNGGVSVGISNSIGAHAGCLVIGSGMVTTAANQCLIGNATSGQDYRTIIFGGGILGASGVAQAARAIRFTNAVGTNIVAGDLTIQAPLSTGNATGAWIKFATGTPQASGTTSQAALIRVSILPVASGEAALRFDSHNNGAGASAGTLGNAPSAGNPTFWLPINIAGNVRYIPCWT